MTDVPPQFDEQDGMVSCVDCGAPYEDTDGMEIVYLYKGDDLPDSTHDICDDCLRSRAQEHFEAHPPRHLCNVCTGTGRRPFQTYLGGQAFTEPCTCIGGDDASSD